MSSMGRGNFHQKAQWSKTNSYNLMRHQNRHPKPSHKLGDVMASQPSEDKKNCPKQILQKQKFNFEVIVRPSENNCSTLKLLELNLNPLNEKLQKSQSASNHGSWTFGTKEHLSELSGVKASKIRNKRLDSFSKRNFSRQVARVTKPDPFQYEGPAFSNYREEIVKTAVSKNPLRSLRNKPKTTKDYVVENNFEVLFWKCLSIFGENDTDPMKSGNIQPDFKSPAATDKCGQSINNPFKCPDEGNLSVNKSYQKSETCDPGRSQPSDNSSSVSLADSITAKLSSEQRIGSSAHSRQECENLDKQNLKVDSRRDWKPSAHRIQDSFTDSRERWKMSDEPNQNCASSSKEPWPISYQRSQQSQLRRDWQPLDHWSQKYKDSRRESQIYDITRPFTDSSIGLQNPDSKNHGSSTDSRIGWPSSGQQNNHEFPSGRNESLDNKGERSASDSRMYWQRSHERNPGSFNYSRMKWQRSDQNYKEPSAEPRKDWQSSDRMYHQPVNVNTRTWQPSDRRFKEPGNDIRRNWQPTDRRYQEPANDSRMNWQQPTQNYQEVATGSKRSWQCSEQRYQEPLNDNRGRWPVSHPTPDEANAQLDETWKNKFTNLKRNHEEAALNKSVVDNKRLRINSESPLNNAWGDSYGVSNTETEPNHFQRGFMNRTLQKKKKEQQERPRKWEKPMVENAPKYTALFQYLRNFKKPLEDCDIEHIKKHIMIQFEEDKKKKPQRKWQPVLLEFSKRDNGLAVECEDQRSFTWLLKRKIPNNEGRMFVSCNALTPVKNVKLNFCITNCSDSPEVVLSKFDKGNRWVNFKQFRVISCNYRDGNVYMVVLTDSRTIAKVKKINWLPRYDNRKVRLYRCKKEQKDNDNRNADESDNDSEEEAGPQDSD